MREILFRGKRVSDGEWVYGNLFIPDREDTPTQICIGTSIIRITYDVIPETVGQYTGLKDKNDKRIFEWDVVKTSHKNGVIEWCDYCASFVVLCKGTFVTENTLSGHEELEVIGNIHDNPELLEDAK